MPDIWTTRIVAAFVFLILAVMICLLCFIEIPKDNHDVFVTLVGVIVGSAGTIITFYFGSSKSSQDKDDALKQLALGDGATK